MTTTAPVVVTAAAMVLVGTVAVTAPVAESKEVLALEVVTAAVMVRAVTAAAMVRVVTAVATAQVAESKEALALAVVTAAVTARVVVAAVMAQTTMIIMDLGTTTTITTAREAVGNKAV